MPDWMMGGSKRTQQKKKEKKKRRSRCCDGGSANSVEFLTRTDRIKQKASGSMILKRCTRQAALDILTYRNRNGSPTLMGATAGMLEFWVSANQGVVPAPHCINFFFSFLFKLRASTISV